jgi:MerR family transcriptional regulator, mercuric resistance operon regulatory protein
MDENAKTRGYAIGEISRKTGVNIETIRYYERIGIMTKPDRTASGYRQFSYEHLKRLSFIRKSRVLGFRLEEIRALLSMVDSRSFSCGEIHEMTMEHLVTVQQKLSDLRALEKALKSMAAKCSKGDVPDCPVIDALFDAA